MSMAVLKLSGIRKTYAGPQGPVEVLKGVDLAVEAGEFVALRGPSGSGKSTLLWIAGTLMTPDAGTVELAGQDVYALSPERRARERAAKIGFVFQQFHLVPYLTVRENVMAPALAEGADGLGELAARADESIRRLGLEPRREHLSVQLSSGERQRVALARALLRRPRLLLADEPTGNLDGENARGVLEELARFAQAGGAVLLVTHSEQAAAAAQRTLSVTDGRLAPAASSNEPCSSAAR